MNIDKILEIAAELGFSDLAAEAANVRQKLYDENSLLVLPLVGEFSSGKTSLINALTDSKKLETATKPTTATIYVIHFGCDKCCATVFENGKETQVDDIADLKNDLYKDAQVINVFDTSTKVPSSTVIVDTPGLSSPERKHREVLTDFLPQADGIFLTVDVNQQITKSLTDFFKETELSKRPVYLIITKCDTKSPADVKATKEYIGKNCNIPIQQIACVSAAKGNLDEMNALFAKIQKDKNSILKKVCEQRTANLTKSLAERIDQLIASTSIDGGFDEALRRQKHDLEAFRRKIDKLVDSMASDIDDLKINISRRFEDEMFTRLDSIAVSSSQNYDAEAVNAVNNTSSLLLNDFKLSVQNILTEKARQTRNSDDSLTLRTIENLDMNGLQISGISYNVDLNSAGHEYDNWIVNGVKVAGAVVAVVATAGTAAAAGGAAAAIDTAVDVADTVTDVASITSNQKTMSRMEQFQQNYNQQSTDLETYNQNIGQQLGQNKGIIESAVGWVTDKTMGKPQRRRAISNYLNDTLMPQFKNEMQRISAAVVDAIRQSLCDEVQDTFEQMNSALDDLKRKKQQSQQEFDAKMSKLKEYKKQLLTN
ncbi:MAG: dynamin family protein [Bacteroidales bacterium]|nr:dynamin family protein [Bacteroidales bacterium]MBR4327541.1 dynamin family protein [Bacteroidales bacterium]